MNHTTGVRQAQKQQSRRALLDAALQLLEEQSLSSLGVREVTRAAGMSPAGFYRHFADLGELGVVLVGEALASLHAMIRAAFAERGTTEELIEHAVRVVADHVREHRAQVLFMVRERFGGVRAVREAIAAELGRFSDEVAQALGAQPSSAGWSADEVRMLAQLYVDLMVITAAALLEADAEGEAEVARTARAQLRLISTGRQYWHQG